MKGEINTKFEDEDENGEEDSKIMRTKKLSCSNFFMQGIAAAKIYPEKTFFISRDWISGHCH